MVISSDRSPFRNHVQTNFLLFTVQCRNTNAKTPKNIDSSLCTRLRDCWQKSNSCDCFGIFSAFVSFSLADSQLGWPKDFERRPCIFRKAITDLFDSMQCRVKSTIEQQQQFLAGTFQAGPVINSPTFLHKHFEISLGLMIRLNIVLKCSGLPKFSKTQSQNILGLKTLNLSGEGAG